MYYYKSQTSGTTVTDAGGDNAKSQRVVEGEPRGRTLEGHTGPQRCWHSPRSRAEQGTMVINTLYIVTMLLLSFCTSSV